MMTFLTVVWIGSIVRWARGSLFESWAVSGCLKACSFAAAGPYATHMRPTPAAKLVELTPIPFLLRPFVPQLYGGRRQMRAASMRTVPPETAFFCTLPPTTVSLLAALFCCCHSLPRLLSLTLHVCPTSYPWLFVTISLRGFESEGRGERKESQGSQWQGMERKSWGYNEAKARRAWHT